MVDKWIAGATKTAHGQFSAKANRAGMTTYQYAVAHKGDRTASGSMTKLAMQAQEALNLMKAGKNRKHRTMAGK